MMLLKLVCQVTTVTLLASWPANAKGSVIPPPPPDSAGAVFTATKIYDTTIGSSPYLTQATTTVVWTESSSPSASPLPSSSSSSSAAAYTVHTATEIYDTIIDTSPYYTQATSTVIWTESASPSPSPSTAASSLST